MVEHEGRRLDGQVAVVTFPSHSTIELPLKSRSAALVSRRYCYPAFLIKIPLRSFTADRNWWST